MKKDLNEIEFPVLFKLCVTPGFKLEKIVGSGYSDLFYYFLGKSKFGNNYGWAGHTSNGSQYSTPASILRDAVVDIKEVLNHITLKF